MTDPQKASYAMGAVDAYLMRFRSDAPDTAYIKESTLACISEQKVDNLSLARMVTAAYETPDKWSVPPMVVVLETMAALCKPVFEQKAAIEAARKAASSPKR